MNANHNQTSIVIALTRSAIGNVFLFLALLASSAQGQTAVGPDALPVNTVVATLKTGTFPLGVVVSSDSTTAYVANDLDNTVSVISAKTLKVEKNLFAGPSPQQLAITSDGTKLYVTNFVNPGTVTLIDLASGSTQTISGLSSPPAWVALSPDGTQLWVADTGIDVIDTATNKVVTHVAVPGGAGPSYVTFTPDGLKAYACAFRGTRLVSVIDTTTDKITTSITVGSPVGPPVIRGNRAYLTKGNNKKGMYVVAIDTSTDTVIKTIRVGQVIPGDQPAFLPGKPYLYAPQSTPGAVTLIDTANNTVVGDGFTCGDGSYDVAIAPNGTQVYVTNEFANTVTIATIK